ncbi:MAG: hypothetical protein HFE81_03310 [Bacilli bacterium]|nr:hypothetical protein [Bacilli bacterium]
MDNKKKKNSKRIKERKQRRLIKRFKLVIILCLLVLVGELGYIAYAFLGRKEESLYFDGINGLVGNDSYYASVGSNNNNDNFFEKAKISKYNEKKEKTFEKLYNVGFNSVFFGVTEDEDNLVAVGSYEKTEEDHDNLIRRALIVKYDVNGEIVFDKDFKILDNSKFTSIKKVDDGYLVTGQSVYKNTKVGDSDGGAILVKFDKDGNVLWRKTYGSNKAAIYNDLLVVNNFIYTVGTDDNYLGIICKYDMDGNLVSYNDYKYTDGIGFSGIVNIGNKIYISGANRVNKSNTDAMIVEYDTDCQYIKQKIYKSKGLDRFNKLIKDDHDNVIAIGTMATNRSKRSRTVDEFDYDGVVGKYNSDLEEIAVVTYGDERDDYFTDIKVVNGNYLVVGYSSYEDGSYLSKFISYSDALKVLGVE